MRYYFTLTVWTIIQKQKLKGIGEDVEKLGPSNITGGNVKRYSCCGKEFGSFSKCYTELLYNAAIPLLDTYPKDLKTRTQTNTCIRMITAALITIAKR